MSKIEKDESAGGQLFTTCPDWGKGGRFVIDGEGKRVRVAEEPEPDAVVDSENPAYATKPEAKKLTGKEKQRG